MIRSVYICSLGLNLLFVSPMPSQQSLIPTISIKAAYRGAHRHMTGMTQSIPPHYIYAVDGYNFVITIRMRYNNSSVTPGSRLDVVCILPDSSVKRFVIHSEMVIEYTKQEYEYSIPVQVKSGGVTSVCVVSSRELENKLPVDQQNGRSNIERVELLIPPNIGR